MQPALLQLILFVDKVHHNRLGHQAVQGLHKGLVGWVRLDVVVAVRDRRELDNKAMRDAVLVCVNMPQCLSCSKSPIQKDEENSPAGPRASCPCRP